MNEQKNNKLYKQRKIWFALGIIGIVAMIATIVITNSIGNWIFCFTSWIIMCITNVTMITITIKRPKDK